LLFQSLRPALYPCIDHFHHLWSCALELNRIPIDVAHEIAKIARKLRKDFQRILFTIEDTESFRKLGEPMEVIRSAIDGTKARGKRRKRTQLITGTIEFNQMGKRRERGDAVLTTREIF
jgi:hypothetical protein